MFNQNFEKHFVAFLGWGFSSVLRLNSNWNKFSLQTLHFHRKNKVECTNVGKHTHNISIIVSWCSIWSGLIRKKCRSILFCAELFLLSTTVVSSKRNKCVRYGPYGTARWVDCAATVTVSVEVETVLLSRGSWAMSSLSLVSLRHLHIFNDFWGKMSFVWREVRKRAFPRFGLKRNPKQKRCEWNERPSC